MSPLDPSNLDDPRVLGLLQFGLGMMKAGGPSRMPQSFLGNFGTAGEGAIAQMQAARQMQMQMADRAAQKRLQDAQISNLDSEVSHRKFQEQQAADLAAAEARDRALENNGILRPPQIATPMAERTPFAVPINPTTSLGGGGGVAGGGAGFGATGSPALSAFRPPEKKPDISNPPEEVIGKGNTEAAMAYKEYLRLTGLANAATSTKGKAEYRERAKDQFSKFSEFAKLEEQQNAINPLPGIGGIFYRHKDGKPYELVKDDKGDIQPRYLTSEEISQRDLKKAEAGATKVSQTASLKAGESVAKELGPMIKESRDEALGAVEQVASAQRIKKGIAAGEVIAGPTAKFRLAGAQIASMLGVTGKTTEETIANTRQVIRGLAEFTISVRKKLKGQGQITEYEQKTLEKAYSGDINEMTVAEIQAMANATEKMGRLSHKYHADQLKNMASDPDENIRKLVPYYSVPDLPETTNKTINRTGTLNGRKVIEYSDGSIEYAN